MLLATKLKRKTFKTMISIAIHESKNSQKVVEFVKGEAPYQVEGRLTKYCSEKYASKIFDAYQNGTLHGVYFTTSGKIKATFI